MLIEREAIRGGTQNFGSELAKNSDRKVQEFNSENVTFLSLVARMMMIRINQDYSVQLRMIWGME